jgi:hypothetical protein
MTDLNKLADELEGLADCATPGPWANGFDDLDCVWSREPSNDGNVVCLPPESMMELSVERWPANADLIIALRNNLPTILSALRDAGKMREALQQIAASCGPHDCEAAYWRCDAARVALKTEGEWWAAFVSPALRSGSALWRAIRQRTVSASKSRATTSPATFSAPSRT